jgi:hypothetical protein
MNQPEATGIFFYNPAGLFPDPVKYDELLLYSLGFPEVVKTWTYLEFVWNEKSIFKKIEEYNLERIIIAGLLPGTVKALF